jgi:DUF1680 family protein
MVISRKGFGMLCSALLAAATMTLASEPPDHEVSTLPWHPVQYKAEAPIGGVTLDDGLFRIAFDNNVDYLMNSFSTNDLLWDFRKRCMPTDPPHDRAPVPFWVTDLLGSNAGRFMMGAGNAVRWTSDPELRKKLDDVIDGIDACKLPNGYCLAYPPEGFLHSEQGNYARAWFTQGLCEAGISGNPKAFKLLRGLMDWFDQCEYLPKLLHLSLGLQGHIASTRAYFTPVGKPEDLKVAEKYYVQDWWMQGLTAHDPTAICSYRLNRPHSYEVVGFMAYLDHYRATGDEKYLKAMTGAWDLMHDDFEHVGGEMAICESGFYPPKSRYISPAHHTGEFCGSVFWVKFNQRFHLLYPDEEKYTAEIEKSIYNIALANQDGSAGIHYHALLQGHKDVANASNTCCEGQGTLLYGSLPEYIYSVAQDGVYVDLFEPSTITFKQGGDTIKLKQLTQFPFAADDALTVSVARPVESIIRVRVPSWASGPMAIAVNGQVVATGKPGTYQPISRTWRDGDTIRFTLPIAFRLTRYDGKEQTAGHNRYFIEYGPILMAVTGTIDQNTTARLLMSPAHFVDSLVPRIGQPLNFEIAGDRSHQLKPYFQVTSETFDCVPMMDEISIKGQLRFMGRQSVAIIAADAGAPIRYTLDGADPTTSSPEYSGPIEITDSATVKARIFRADGSTSDVVSEDFKKLPLYAPSILLAADRQTVLIRVPYATPDVAIRYTLDGTTPTEASPLYTAPLPAPTAGTTITARAFLKGLAPSEVASATLPADASESPAPRPDVFLSDLKPFLFTAGWMTPRNDRNIRGNPLKLGGNTYAKGIGTHAKSVLIYDIKPEYKRFVATAGIDDETHGLGLVTFQAWVDDALKYETPPVRGNNDLWRIDVPIPPGARELKLVLTIAGDDYNYDFGDWADAGFVTGASN